MGARGPLPKSADRRQRRNKSSPSTPIITKRRKVPLAPEGLLAETARRWTVFWKSAIGELVTEVEIPRIERLFQRYDERARAFAAVREARMVKGSQGQPVANPLLKYIDACDNEIRQLEDRLGFSSARAHLPASNEPDEDDRSLDALNRRLEADPNGKEASDADDPRIVASIRPK